MDSLLSIEERRAAALAAALAAGPLPPIPDQDDDDDASPPPSPKGKGGRRKAEGAAPQKGKPDPGQPLADEVERRILASLANPAHGPLTVGDRCQILGISRATWYRKTADPLFRSRSAAAVRDAAGDRLGPVLDVLATSALVEGQDGHQDRKLYLQLVGMVQQDPARQRGDDDTDPATGKPKTPGLQLTDPELIGVFEGCEQIWLPVGLLRRAGMDPDAGKTKGDGTDGKPN